MANVTGEMRVEKSRARHLAPLFVLLVLAPAVAELLLGDMVLNVSFPFLFLFNLSYYGTGAIIIREIVRRRGLHWGWIPILAFAYGLIEEGLVLHTLFNPNFAGIGALGYYGRAFGVDWIWSMYVLGLHTVWSISVPILVTELFFPRVRRVSWIGNVGLVIICVVFVLALVILTAIFLHATPGLILSPLALGLTALLALLIVLLALFLPLRRGANEGAAIFQGRAPQPWLVGIFVFVLGGIFAFLPRTFRLFPSLPAPVAALIYLLLAALVVLVIVRWSTPGGGWNKMHQVALACGALLDYCVIGFLVSKSDMLNQAFHAFVVALTVILLVVLIQRTQARTRPQVEAQALS